jgi:hypothetical protein
VRSRSHSRAVAKRSSPGTPALFHRGQRTQPKTISTAARPWRAFQDSTYPASTARSCRSLTLFSRCTSISLAPCFTARHDEALRNSSRSSRNSAGSTRNRTAAAVHGSARDDARRIAFMREGNHARFGQSKGPRRGALWPVRNVSDCPAPPSRPASSGGCRASLKDGALMEPRGCNRPQPPANPHGP